MSGSSLGRNFVVSTCGESHGKALMVIIDGCPPGVELSISDIQPDLDRRAPGRSKHTSQRKEADSVEIVSGVFEGKTTGTAIGLIVHNQNQKSKDYNDIADKYRPGHADYTYQKKYGIRDYRGGGRSSARTTVMRVAAGAVAKKVMKFLEYDIDIKAYLSCMGDIKIAPTNLEHIAQNDFFAPDLSIVPILEARIKELRKLGNSVGARVCAIIKGVPVGLGEPIFDGLDADLAKAIMSINAVKGVEIGDGFSSVHQLGSEHRDEINTQGFLSNHAGGVLGGISSGQDIVISAAFKPTSSILLTANTLNHAGEECKISVKGRHDPCVGIRAVPIVESMVALTLLDHMIRHRAQCGPSI